MASTYNFMGLVNDVCLRLNEQPLTSSNFDSAVGFYHAAKTYVNAAIRDINQREYNWPFNHNTTELFMDAGTNRYGFPAEAKVIDFDTVRVVKDDALGVSSYRLKQIQYNEYVDKYIDQEFNDAANGGAPKLVARSQAQELVFVPMPDKDYEIQFEYFIYPVDLINATDVPTIPERYRHVIIDGAMHYAYMFRDNAQSAAMSKDKFDEGIKAMLSIMVNEFINLRSTHIQGRG